MPATPFSEAAASQPGRVIDTPDPALDKIFSESAEDRVGGLIQNLPGLTLKQKVHGLLLLTDEESADFRDRRKGGAEVQLSVMQNQVPGLVDKADYIKAVSQLRDAVPRYEVMAEIRRRQQGKYPPEWDAELDEDPRFVSGDGLLKMKACRPLSYEEAVEFTKFEHVRSWYNNVFFSRITSLDNPVPLTIATLTEMFRQERSQIFDVQKPGTDIAIADLLPILDYYEFDRNADNPQSVSVHRQVRQLAGIVKELEEAVKQ